MQYVLAGTRDADVPTSLSRWTSRIALFSFGLLVAAAFLHRLFAMPTPVAINLVIVAYGGVALTLLTAALAAIGIWRSGAAGASRIVFGVALSLLMLAGPLALALVARDYPPINDVTTDVRSPPQFTKLAALRGSGANSPVYPGEKFAQAQADAYPDLKPMTFNRSSEEAFELAVEALKRLNMQIVRDDAPTETQPGMIEAVDRTLVAGFYDDVAIRVTGDAERARVDIRSASRYGNTDFGQNAERIRGIMREIVARLDATVPAADQAGAKPAKPLKRGKEGDPRSANPRRSRDRAQ